MGLSATEVGGPPLSPYALCPSNGSTYWRYRVGERHLERLSVRRLEGALTTGIRPLAMGIAFAISVPAHAVVFNVGAVDAQLDTSLTVESAWGTAHRDRNLIGAQAGGRGLAGTGDAGRLNFKQGEPFTKRVTGWHGLELKYGDSGIYVSGRYWYDFEQKDESRRHLDIDDSGRDRLAQASGAALLDAYFYHHYRLQDQPGQIRLGKQVVNWGEGIFFQNGLDIVNPVERSAYHRPGTLRQAGALPVNLAYASQNLTDNLSIDGFYALEWDRSVDENCGTFFAGSDISPQGCNAGLSYDADGVPVTVPRSGTRNARNGGQWGLASHYSVAPLDADVGLYVVKYHSRDAMLSGTTAPAVAYAGGIATVAAGSRYYSQYPEDIRLYGLTFSKQTATGTTWRSELSYRPNAPVALNGADLANAAFALDDPSVSPLRASPGSDLKGYRRLEVTQLQADVEQALDNVMGAERLTLLGEAAWVHTAGLSGRGERFGRDPVFGPGPLADAGCVRLNAATLGGAGPNVARYCENEGFVTSNAWGYRIKAVWEYPDVVQRTVFKPNLAWSHDVNGYGPNGSLSEGAKAVSLGLDAVYQNTYRAAVAYSTFFGGRYNTLVDRDFLSLSIGLDF